MSYDNKYNSLGMALCAFIGASFLNPTANTIWIIAGILLLGIFIGAFLQLPSDTYNKDNQKNLDPTLPNIKENIGNLFFIIKEKKQMLYGLVVTSVLLIYFQTILQLWQPMIKNVNPSALGWLYGVFFGIVSTAQLLSSYAINSNIKNKHRYILFCIFTSMVLMALVNFWLYKSILATILTLLSLFMMFFGIKFLMIETSARFHDVIPSNHRSFLDAMGFFISRTVLLIIFPIITYLIQAVGFISLPIIFFILIALYIPTNHRFKSCDD